MNEKPHYCSNCEADVPHEKWLREKREAYGEDKHIRCEDCDDAYAEAYFG